MIAAGSNSTSGDREPRHVTVYRQAGRFAGWPANYGIWSWDDEIVTGFWVGRMDLTQPFHKRSRSEPMSAFQARSLDGGETWQVRPAPCPTPDGRTFSADEHVAPAHQIRTILDVDRDLRPFGGINFAQSDLAILCARTGLEPGAISWFYLSTDRCHRWDGPFTLPSFGLPGTMARTDYVILNSDSCLLFLTASKRDGREGRVFCARTDDGGRNFCFLAWIGPEPGGYAIMPSTVLLGGPKLRTAIRRRDCAGPTARERCWIALWGSDDSGRTWHLICADAAMTGHNGNPPSLIRLHDGRLCLTYGYRDTPFGIRAKLSANEGASWGEEIVLRADGGDGDLGYVRSVQRADDAIVTVYYHNEHADGERYIAATIWCP